MTKAPRDPRHLFRAALATLLIALAALLTACAKEPAGKAPEGPIPMLAPGHARIVVYRPANPFLVALRPEVVINNMSVGRAVAGSAFSREARAGAYTAFLAGAEDEPVAFTLPPDATAYLRISPKFALIDSRLILELMDPLTGAEESNLLMRRDTAN